MLSGIPPTPCTFSCLSVTGASRIIVRWAMGLPSGTPKFSVTIPLSYLSVSLGEFPSQFLVLTVVRTLAIQLSLISGAYRISFSVLGAALILLGRYSATVSFVCFILFSIRFLPRPLALRHFHYSYHRSFALGRPCLPANAWLCRDSNDVASWLVCQGDHLLSGREIGCLTTGVHKEWS